MDAPRQFLEHDWYPGGIPANVHRGRDVYIDTSYAFAAFASRRDPGLLLGDASGIYDCAAFVVGTEGLVTVGSFTCLNGTYVICESNISIGNHCLLAWGVVITDCWPDGRTTLRDRKRAVRAAARRHTYPTAGPPRPVLIEDNVWVGFDSVILPGVTLGRGCIVGCRTIVRQDVPPYAILVGDPPRVVRYLDPGDTDEAREDALTRCRRA
jgi:acetyltransferase-like isoleucine patch superfamily enzyme